MSKTVEAEAVAIILNSLSTVFVALRVISRFGILKCAFTDDYLILVALVLSWCYTGLLCARELYEVGSPRQLLSKTLQKVILAWAIIRTSSQRQTSRPCLRYNTTHNRAQQLADAW